MSEENVEVARRLYPGEVDVVAVLADRNALDTALGCVLGLLELVAAARPRARSAHISG
jgi:hypothetical protein